MRQFMWFYFVSVYFGGLHNLSYLRPWDAFLYILGITSLYSTTGVCELHEIVKMRAGNLIN